ncbi:MAG: class I SAM-dependent methyltransferase [Planctomycetota bacterium]
MKDLLPKRRPLLLLPVILAAAACQGPRGLAPASSALVPPADFQEASVQPGVNDSFNHPDVAQFVERFEREGREVFDKRQEIVDAAGIHAGWEVADVGAGTGLFEPLLSHAVGTRGKVFAVDISADFLEHIAERARKEHLGNVTTLLATDRSSSLAPRSIDMAFLCDVYHHFEYPQHTLDSIHAALRAGGEMVVIDFDRIEGQSSPWILKHMRAGKGAFIKEIEAAGFRLVEDKQGLLESSYFLRFRKEG